MALSWARVSRGATPEGHAGKLLGGDLAQVSWEVCLPYLQPHHQGQYLPRASGLTCEQGGDGEGGVGGRGRCQPQLEASTAPVCASWVKA